MTKAHLAIVALALLLPAPLLPQANVGTILGNVSDQSGAAIVGAQVTAVNTDTGFKRTAETTVDGSYLIQLLPIGAKYTVTVEAHGFKQQTQTGIVLQLNQNLRVDAQMSLGQVAETVEVSGAPPLVDTYSAQRGDVVEQKRITELPLNGRNPLQLAGLVTGVTNISTRTTLDSGNRNGSFANVNGSRANEMDFQLNGMRFAGSYSNSGLNYPNPDALQEFKLITNPISAEYGMFSGAVFTAVTRSGTNQLHASLFEFLRNDKLNARNYFASTVPILRQNQFGVSGGAPIIKNKIFAFGSYQGIRIRNQALASSFPLTSAERSGLISSATPVIDPLTKSAFPRDGSGQYIIPESRFDPTSRYLLDKVIPVAPASGLLITTGARKVDVNQYSGKFDFNLSPTDQVYVSGLFDRTRPDDPFFYGPYTGIGRLDQSQRVYVLSVGHTHTFTPTIFNDLRVGFSGQQELKTPQNAVNPAAMGIQNWDYAGVENDNFKGANINPPYIPVSGRFSLGAYVGGPWREGGENWQVSDTIRVQAGKHSLSAGIDFYKRSHYLDANVFNTGAFTFNGNVTGNATADFLLGRMGDLTRVRYVNHPGYRSWTRSFFVQDDWKIAPRLTLNLGLRYELLYPFEEFRAQEDTEIGWNTHGGLGINGGATYRQGVQSTVLPLAPRGLVFPGDKTPEFPGGLPNGLIPLDKMQFQPRVGLAWDPFGNGKTSVRSSIGFFSNALYVDIAAQEGQNLPFVVIQTSPQPAGPLSNPYSGLTPFPKLTTQNITSNPDFFQPYLPSAAYGWDPNYRMPRIMNMTFNVQQQVTRALMVEAGYVGKLSRNLNQTRNINSAIYIPGQSTFANVDSRRRLEPGVFQAIVWQESASNAGFHSFQSTIRWQASKGLTLLSAYTWSHSIDYWSTIAAGSALFQNPENTKPERGSSDFDRRHVYRLSWVYELPAFSKGPSLVKRTLNGWQTSGIFSAQSGAPFTVVTGRDFSMTGAGFDRPNLTGDPYLPSRSQGATLQEYYAKSAFSFNSEGTFGNFGRNVLTGPRAVTVDLGIIKNIAITEQHRLQFRAELFNLFNHTNFGQPNGNLSSPAFMRISTAGEPRLIQFALKYSF
ncbi:TonB-dependent receptor domain-containing protein [Paludibaculum fermentans]|uniref:TonB-dependent receptor n=1 Tax=Paludibaculum fermentans TaxID=1473598 RepID=UPI003EBE7ED2